MVLSIAIQHYSLSIHILLLARSQDWTWNLQMIVSFEALGINTYNR